MRFFRHVKPENMEYAMLKQRLNQLGMTLLIAMTTLLSATVSTGLAMDYFVNPVAGAGNYQTIGDALAGVPESGGDYHNRIIVADGTYNETNLDFAGKNIVLQSEDGPETTIIDCQGAGRAFSFSQGETSQALLSGFTVRNCSDNYGGAINIGNASPTISNMIFENNHSSYGGALYIVGSSSTIERCRFENNAADLSLTEPRGGAGYLANYTGKITDSLFVGNSADNYGGALDVSGTSDLQSNNNTFVNNHAPRGGVIDLNAGGGGVSIVNSILWGNSATTDEGDIAYMRAGSMTVLFSDVQGMEAAFFESGGNLDDFISNIDADPLFADVDDFHLTASSPCVNPEDSSSPVSTLDLDGLGRRDGFTLDMGAYEFRVFETFGLAELLELTGGGSSIQDAVDSFLVGSGDTIVLPEGVFSGSDMALSCSKDITIRSASGPDGTIIDMGEVLEEFSYGWQIMNGAHTVIEGLTFRNAHNGASPLTITNASPTIRNCTFQHNTKMAMDNVIYKVGGGAIKIVNDDASILRTVTHIADSTFVHNNGTEHGGALYVAGGVATELSIEGSLFRDNRSNLGGAVAIDEESPASLVIKRSNFTGNNAGINGGALYLASVPYLLAENSLFLQNDAVSGGAIFLDSKGASFLNAYFNFCTFSGNHAASFGGALYFLDADHPYFNVQMYNSILWGNSCDISTGGNQITGNTTFMTLHQVDMQGGIEGAGLGSNSVVPNLVDLTDVDPKFAFADNPRLLPGSPCIDAGAAPTGLTIPATDVTGVTTRDSVHPDLGAYEQSNAAMLAASPEYLHFVYRTGDDKLPDLQYLSLRNSGTLSVEWHIESNAPWLTVEPLAGQNPLDPDTTETVKVFIAYDLAQMQNLVHGTHDAALQILDSTGHILQSIAVELTVARTLHVAAGGIIQNAINTALDGDIVLVASGTYTWQTIDFQGKGIVLRSENGPTMTILDGENSYYHSIEFQMGEGRDTVVDGFTFTRFQKSAVVLHEYSSPEIVNCNFTSNMGDYGAGILINGSWGAYIANCRFEDNQATQGGGGLSINSGSFNTIVDCVFQNNLAAYGGGLQVGDTNYNLTNFNTISRCDFTNNRTNDANGGGINLDNSVSDLIQGCIFKNNKAFNSGGGMMARLSTALVTNCLFLGERNSSDPEAQWGGAIAQEDSNPDDGESLQIINCTIVNNVADHGGGIYLFQNTPVINTIISGNSTINEPETDEYSYYGEFPPPEDPTTYGVQTSLIEGALGENGGTVTFVDPATGDYRLAPGSVGIDQGSDITWLFSDLRGSYRAIDGDDNGNEAFDIGAYEYSRYFGGTGGDKVARAFKELQIKSSIILTGHEYQVEWLDRDPFPMHDDRVNQAGEYGVTLALVSASGRFVPLATRTMQISQIGYSLPVTFGPEHIGTWRLHLQLSSDPNQFVESEPFIIEHKDVDTYYLGMEIPAPEGADTAQKPDVDLEEAVYWSVEQSKLYAVAPYTVVITWYEDEAHTSTIPMVANISAPANPQIHIARSQPVELLPEGTPYDAVELLYTGSGAILNANTFSAVNEGYSVLLYRDDQAQTNAGKEVFQVVRTAQWNHNQDLNFPISANATIGDALTDAEHSTACGNGYVFFEQSWYDGTGENRAYDRTTRQGPIIPVNEDLSGLNDATGANGNPDDLVVVWYEKDSTTGVCWPNKPVRYTPVWPTSPDKIIIAGGQGSGPLDPEHYGTQDSMLIYNQPDATLPGYNPNEEHAAFFTAQGSSFPAVFALRNDINYDINNVKTSEPYVLFKYREPQTNIWKFHVYKVEATDPGHPFTYENVAGHEINPFYPMNQMAFGPCPESTIVDGDDSKVLKDKDNKFFAKNGGVSGSPTDSFGIRYFYRLQQDFYYDRDGDGNVDESVGTCIPFLDHNTSTPQTITYDISWPDPVPTLFVGETLTKPKTQEGESVGLPNVADQCSVEVLFDQSVAESTDPQVESYSVNLIDPLTEYAADYPLSDPLSSLPADLKPEYDLATGRYVFTALPEQLKSRLTYDPVAGSNTIKGMLKLKGVYSEGTGESLLLLNTLSVRDVGLIENVYPDTGDGFWTAVSNLQTTGNTNLGYPVTGYPRQKDAEMKALSAGDAHGTGYVTLAFNNDPDCTAPTMLSVIRVGCGLYRGDIKVLESANPFAEKVTLRHNGDFGGNSDNRSFEWQYLTADFSGIPTGPDNSGETWQPYVPQPDKGIFANGDGTYKGAVDTVIQGTGQQLLPDKWFAARYHFDGACSQTTSAWTDPQLYEGWIKRVMKKINLYDQVVTNFHASDVDTMSSMIAQAGIRYEGDIALSDDPEYLQGLGMIEVYETLLNRGESLAAGGGDQADLNKALLFASNRLADLYMLLGNEAFGDAADPTIGFSTADGQYGFAAPSIFCFQNQMDSLLDEELALLRGLDNTGIRPFYNRLIWNFTLGDGEVAYKENYNITDQDQDGDVDEYDAMIQYPQGHGDAWGYYLSAVKKYYHLLKSNNFTWLPQSEAILVAGTPVSVDYRDERKFAKAAAAKARTGAEIVNLTYRKFYSEDPENQWQGYKDADNSRVWGLDGWSKRAGVGAYYDWVVGNAILPEQDNEHEGIARVDRTTVVELQEIASRFTEIQSEVTRADVGINPIGIAKGEVPFDIDPTRVANGESHFEQIYDRALSALNNAVTVYNHANSYTSMLRHQQDSLDDFKRNIENSEADYNNRLIEIFGYPYAGDCGPGKTYSTSYCQSGPDLYHYMYADPSYFLGMESPEVYQFTVTVKDIDVDETGALVETEKQIPFNVDTDSRFGLIKPDDWGARKAPGELQIARSSLLQSRARFEKAIDEYDNLLNNIEQQAQLISDQHDVNLQEIKILNTARDQQVDLNAMINQAREKQMDYRTQANDMTLLGNGLAEALPTSVGFSIDAASVARSLIKLQFQLMSREFSQQADDKSLNELDHQQAKEIVSLQSNIDITSLKNSFAIEQQLLQLQNLIRSEATLRLEIYNLIENLRQTADQYLGTLSKGDRLLADRLRIRRQTAAQITDYRYSDMSFRIFRNEALQQYRAQFDMAGRYVYLAAKAYDYETTLLDADSRAGETFLTSIVKQRTIGRMENGQPLTGTGLADPMKRMYQNFMVLKSQLGFNNPQIETNRFSLRQELMRIMMDSGSNANWHKALRKYWVDDLWSVPEFRRYCRPFAAEGIAQPALVIPFSTTVTSGLNFFGWPLGAGDSYYSATNFATKIRAVGVWFSNYNAAGLSQTPRIYLVPVGEDVLRTPSSTFKDIRTWQVVDEKLPIPFPIDTAEITDNPNWIPTVDTIFDEMFGIRKHSDFRAYHDSGYLNESEMQYDSRLIGRSVWNSKWVLIIPGQSLLYDPVEGLDTFIDGPLVLGGNGERTGDGIFDIKLFFETYGYSGN